MKQAFLFLTMCAFFLTLKASDSIVLKTGDLLFQISGTSDFSKAISASTGVSDMPDFVHVGIVVVEDDTVVNVFEASPEAGVRIVDINKFLDSSPKAGNRPGVVVKRLSADFDAGSTAENAKKYLGEEYDWWYLPDNGKMYCSELVYESFLSPEGEHIFQASPMNFRDADGNMPEFWIKLYEKLGVDIPEGIPGTNPNSLSQDSRLEEIYRYF